MASSLLPPPGLRFSTVVAAASAASLGLAHSLMSGLASQGEDCFTAAGLPIVLGLVLGLLGLFAIGVTSRRWKPVNWSQLGPWLVVNGALLAPALLYVWV